MDQNAIIDGVVKTIDKVAFVSRHWVLVSARSSASHSWSMARPAKITHRMPDEAASFNMGQQGLLSFKQLVRRLESLPTPDADQQTRGGRHCVLIAKDDDVSTRCPSVGQRYHREIEEVGQFGCRDRWCDANPAFGADQSKCGIEIIDFNSN